MGIYDYTTSSIAGNVAPPQYRTPKFLDWLISLLSPLQWLRDLFFDNYVTGFTGPIWTAGSYIQGARVRYKDHSVYEASVATTGEPSISTDWVKIQSIWIGSDERSKYNGGKLLLEYALNKWFDTIFQQPTANVSDISGFYTPRSDIYITNQIPFDQVFIFANDPNTASAFTDSNFQNFFQNAIDFDASCFVINIPLAVYDALKPSDPSGTTVNKDNIVRTFADKYVAAGITYSINPY